MPRGPSGLGDERKSGRMPLPTTSRAMPQMPPPTKMRGESRAWFLSFFAAAFLCREQERGRVFAHERAGADKGRKGVERDAEEKNKGNGWKAVATGSLSLRRNQKKSDE